MVMFPLTFLSNAFVPTDTMPPWLQAFANAQPGLPHHLRDPRPGQRRPGHRAGRLGAARLRRRSSRSSRRCRCGASPGRCEPGRPPARPAPRRASSPAAPAVVLARSASARRPGAAALGAGRQRLPGHHREPAVVAERRAPAPAAGRPASRSRRRRRRQQPRAPSAASGMPGDRVVDGRLGPLTRSRRPPATAWSSQLVGRRRWAGVVGEPHVGGQRGAQRHHAPRLEPAGLHPGEPRRAHRLHGRVQALRARPRTRRGPAGSSARTWRRPSRRSRPWPPARPTSSSIRSASSRSPSCERGQRRCWRACWTRPRRRAAGPAAVRRSARAAARLVVRPALKSSIAIWVCSVATCQVVVVPSTLPSAFST